jgi:hypothetical protein
MHARAIPVADSAQFAAQNNVIFLENLAGELQRKCLRGNNVARR